MPEIKQVDDDQTVAFQDPGTGIDGSYGTPGSAGIWAASDKPRGYVSDGLDIITNGSSIGVNRGVAFLMYSGNVQVQSESRGEYDRQWRGDVLFPVSIPSVSDISLDVGEVNDVYLAVDLSEPNSVSYHVGHNINAPDAPYLAIATVDESTGDITRLNDWKPSGTRYEPTDVRDLSPGDNVSDLVMYHDGSGDNVEGPATYNGTDWISLVDNATIE